MWRRRAVHVALAIPSLWLVACGGGEAERSSTTCEAEGAEISVSADDFQFDTDCVAVPAGQELTVTFRNDDWEVHNFTVIDEGESRLSAERLLPAAPGREATATWASMDPGRYAFLCTIHPTMDGVFVVEQQ